MFFHKHPYPPFINADTTRLIVGTLPPPRFTTGLLKPGDVDFCYGSIDGQLWLILDKLYNLNLTFETTEAAIAQRKQFLLDHKIGICDMVESAYRAKIDASDTGMQQVVLRDLIHYIRLYPKVHTLLFTGGNSKNGPEYFFRKNLKEYGLSLLPVETSTPKIHRFLLDNREIKTVSLTAPSGSANRAVGNILLYQKQKRENPDYTTIHFRMDQYKPFFDAE